MTGTNAPMVRPEIKVSEMISDAEAQLLKASEIMEESLKEIKEIAGDLIEKQETLDDIATNTGMSLEEKCREVKGVIRNVIEIIMNNRDANNKVIHELENAKEGVLGCRDNISRNAQLALYDQLTGAGNRHKYYEDMKDMIEYLDRGNGYISFAILDIDKFKDINDQHGHTIGDAVLKTFSLEIKNMINTQENQELALRMYRWGGEEFVIVGRSSITEIYRILDDFRKKIARKTYRKNAAKVFQGKVVEEERIQFTFSGGISGTNTSSQIEHLFPSADKKLYQSKQGGRDRITA